MVAKEWRDDTKNHCAATDVSIRGANTLREEAEWLIKERKNVTDRAQKDVKFRLTEKVTDTRRSRDAFMTLKWLKGTWRPFSFFSFEGYVYFGG